MASPPLRPQRLRAKLLLWQGRSRCCFRSLRSSLQRCLIRPTTCRTIGHERQSVVRGSRSRLQAGWPRTSATWESWTELASWPHGHGRALTRHRAPDRMISRATIARLVVGTRDTPCPVAFLTWPMAALYSSASDVMTVSSGMQSRPGGNRQLLYPPRTLSLAKGPGLQDAISCDVRLLEWIRPCHAGVAG